MDIRGLVVAFYQMDCLHGAGPDCKDFRTQEAKTESDSQKYVRMPVMRGTLASVKIHTRHTLTREET